MSTPPPICDHLPMVTEPIWEGHLTGLFEGYAFDRLYELSDGSNWRQIGETREYV